MKPPSSGSQRNSGELPEEPVFFFEESLGSKIAQIVSEAGFRVTTHAEHFALGAPDTIWVPDCARRGWIIVTKDKRIRRRANELAAVRVSGARMFYFSYGNARAEEYAESMIQARGAILRAIATERPPFIARISPAGKISVEPV